MAGRELQLVDAKVQLNAISIIHRPTRRDSRPCFSGRHRTGMPPQGVCSSDTRDGTMSYQVEELSRRPAISLRIAAQRRLRGSDVRVQHPAAGAERNRGAFSLTRASRSCRSVHEGELAGRDVLSKEHHGTPVVFKPALLVQDVCHENAL